jgi:hypothetical protein
MTLRFLTTVLALILMIVLWRDYLPAQESINIVCDPGPCSDLTNPPTRLSDLTNRWRDWPWGYGYQYPYPNLPQGDWTTVHWQMPDNNKFSQRWDWTTASPEEIAQAQPPEQVPGPYDPHHVIPPMVTGLSSEQTKMLAQLLPVPGTANAAKVVESNKARITAITGPEQYQKILAWEKAHEPQTVNPNPPAKKY